MFVGSGSYGRVFEEGEGTVIKYSRGELTPSQVREIHALSAGFGTRGICEFREAWLVDGRFAISLERYDCDSTRAPQLDFLKLENIAVLRRRARGLLTALANLHDLRIMHRDVKPDNVLFRGDSVVLCDFGLSRQTTAGVRTTSPRCLSNRLYAPSFRAPEVDMGRFQWASDVYAAGVVLYYFATGRYLCRSHRRLYSDSGKDLRAYVDARLVHHLGRTAAAGLIGEFSSLVASMLARRPRDRPSARACLDHPFFGRAAAGAETPPRPAPVSPPERSLDCDVGAIVSGPDIGGWIPKSGASAEAAYLAWRAVRDWGEPIDWRMAETSMYAACMAAAASSRCRSLLPSLPLACANIVCKYLHGRRPLQLAASVEIEALRLTRGRVLPPESDDLVERLVEEGQKGRHNRPEDTPGHMMDTFGRLLLQRPGLLTDPGLPSGLSYYVRGDDLPDIASSAWRVFQVLVGL
jgi:serine/threonine protein kinase